MISGTRYRLNAEIARQSRLAQEIARAQTDISTEKRLQVASDDPVAAARIADIRRAQENEKAWAANVESSAALASRADNALATVASALDRARELMVSANNDTLSTSGRAAIAVELRGIVADINNYANQRDARGQPLFPSDAPLEVPIGGGLYANATLSRAVAFDGVATSGGPKSLADIVGDAADAIELADPAARRTASNASLAEVSAANDHIATTRSQQGVLAARLDAVRERLANSGLVLAEERGALEDTDIPATVTKLQARLLSLQAAQSVFARISSQSLFDLLR